MVALSCEPMTRIVTLSGAEDGVKMGENGLGGFVCLIVSNQFIISFEYLHCFVFFG